MIGTYVAAIAVGGASLAIGQAALALCGARRWSWLAPAIGLGLVCAIAWATVRMPGEGLVSALAILFLALAAAIYLRRRLEGGGGALRTGLPVALGALLAASLPFVVEGHFGILGTGFNPDMSQHLLATDRLAHDETSQLLRQGYPLGPHAVVVALNKSLGIGLVQAFTGLTVATAVIAPLTTLAALPNSPATRRTAAALVVGLTYLFASYYAQGAFKELIQATLVLAFVLALRESTRTWRQLPLRYVPTALIAIGTVYIYSFPGLTWLASTAAIYLLAEWIWPHPAPPAGGTGRGVSPPTRRPLFRPTHSLGRPQPPPGEKPSTGGDTPLPGPGPAGLRPVALALLVLLIGTLPELSRMLDFHSFETFDPAGPGLGNLFGQISPFEALGIWPSGDFRVAPGDGAAPAFVYYIGAAFATALLLLGLRRCRRQGERAILAGIVAVAGVYVAARLGGTPYTSAKALEIAAPLLTLTILLPVSSARGEGLGGSPAVGTLVYLLAAGFCSLLAFVNAPVGPTSYAPALTELRPLLGTSPTLVLAPDSLLADEHGERYIAWELRGGRVCVEPESGAGGTAPPGIRFVVTDSTTRRPFRQLRLRRRADPYLVWERRGVLGGPSPCPLIAERQVRAAP